MKSIQKITFAFKDGSDEEIQTSTGANNYCRNLAISTVDPDKCIVIIDSTGPSDCEVMYVYSMTANNIKLAYATSSGYRYGSVQVIEFE